MKQEIIDYVNGFLENQTDEVKAAGTAMLMGILKIIDPPKEYHLKAESGKYN